MIGSNGRFAIVVSKFNPSITGRLLDGATRPSWTTAWRTTNRRGLGPRGL